MDPVLGSLVYQLPEGVTLAYDLHLGCTITHRKGIDEEIHLNQILYPYLRCPIVKKNHLGPQNGLRSLGIEKLLKTVNCQKIVLSQLE